jgi:hypothetical protein
VYFDHLGADWDGLGVPGIYCRAIIRVDVMRVGVMRVGVMRVGVMGCGWLMEGVTCANGFQRAVA